MFTKQTSAVVNTPCRDSVCWNTLLFKSFNDFCHHIIPYNKFNENSRAIDIVVIIAIVVLIAIVVIIYIVALIAWRYEGLVFTIIQYSQ